MPSASSICTALRPAYGLEVPCARHMYQTHTGCAKRGDSLKCGTALLDWWLLQGGSGSSVAIKANTMHTGSTLQACSLLLLLPCCFCQLAATTCRGPTTPA